MQALIVEWFKSMISNGKNAYVVDPKLPEMPSSMELKRIILVALRCVDPDVNPRLKMGDVVQMLETNLLLFDVRTTSSSVFRNLPAFDLFLIPSSSNLLKEHQIIMEHCEHNHSPHHNHTPEGLDDTHLEMSRRLSSSSHYQKVADQLD